MSKTVDRILSPLVFQVLIVLSTALLEVHFIHSAYSRYLKCILVFGILVCFWQLIRGNLVAAVKNKAGIALLCFALLYAFTVVLNNNLLFSQNLKQLVYMVVFFLLLFAFCEESNSMIVISAVLTAITFLLSFFSLLTYILRINEWYIVDDEKFYIGQMVSSTTRFWGLYNPNSCGAIAVVSIIASVYLLFKLVKLSGARRIILSFAIVLNILVQYFVLLLSESRGAFYSLAAVIAATVFIGILKLYRKEKYSAPMRALLAIGLVLISLICFLTLSAFIQKNTYRFHVVSVDVADNPQSDTMLEDFIENILKKYSSESSAFAGVIRANVLALGNDAFTAVDRGDDGSTGRLTIWKEGFALFLQKPVFGLTREGLIELLSERATSSVDGAFVFNRHSVVSGGLHNIYLTVLFSSGIVGFISFILAIGIVLVRFIKNLFVEDRISMEELFSFAMCAYFLISELVESRILYTVSFYNVVFWIYLGYLNYYSLKGKKSDGEKS